LMTTSSAEIEILKGQIELLKSSLTEIKEASRQMSDGFKNYVSAIQVCFGFLGFGTAFLSGAAAFFYGKSLKEAKETIDTEVKSEVSRQIKRNLSGRISYLENIIEREEVIDKVNIEYLVVGINNRPIEHNFLAARGFNMSSISHYLENANLRSEVLILDLVNSRCSEPEKSQLVTDIGTKIENQYHNLVLVIYINGRLDAITNLSRQVYYLPANSNVALIGAVVNAAHVGYALRHGASRQ
jgi:hypothetical protein